MYVHMIVQCDCAYLRRGACVHTRARAHARTHARTHAHTYIHTHTHTHM